MDIGCDPPSAKILPGDSRGKPPEVTGTGTKVRFDLHGGLPGNLELILVKLGEDFFRACLMQVQDEKEDSQQSSCRQRNSNPIFSHNSISGSIRTFFWMREV
jgi:hypothetical protein